MSTHTESLHGLPINEQPATKGLDFYMTLGRCLLLRRGWDEFEKTLEETAREAKLKGGYVCLPINQEHGDLVVVQAAPFNPERRVDHIWGKGADVFVWNREDPRSSSQVHIEADSGLVESRSLSSLNIANIVHFVRQHRQQAVVSNELLKSVADRERSLYEQLHVDLEPIAA